LAAEIWDQNLYLRARAKQAHLPHGFCPNGGSSVCQLVAIDGSDNYVFELHALNCFGNAARLIQVELRWASGHHVAESTAPRANVGENHESGGGARPALAAIRTGSRLAHCMQVVSGDQIFHALIGLACRQADFQPGRLSVASWFPLVTE